MILTIDIGNTQITIGAFENDLLKFVSRLSTDKFRTYDQYTVELKGILDVKGVPCSEISGAIISSVVPKLTTNFKKAIEVLFNTEAITIESDLDLDLDVKMRNICKGQLGGDLVVGAIATIKLFSYPSIVVDIGTATSLLVIDKDGFICGGTISPGPAISVDALTQHCDLIPGIDLRAPQHLISGVSAEALRSGILCGTASMIDGMCSRINEEYNYDFNLIITGGISSLIAPLCKTKYTLAQDLLLDGLRIIYNEKTQNK